MPASSAPGQCRCGHLEAAHQHLRRGSECALCDCGRFRSRRPLLRALLRVTGWRRDPSTP